MVEFVWGNVGAAVVSDGVMEVSGSLAINEQVSSSIMVSSSDCFETDFRRISESCWHLDFFGLICFWVMNGQLETRVHLVRICG